MLYGNGLARLRAGWRGGLRPTASVACLRQRRWHMAGAASPVGTGQTPEQRNVQGENTVPPLQAIACGVQAIAWHKNAVYIRVNCKISHRISELGCYSCAECRTFPWTFPPSDIFPPFLHGVGHPPTTTTMPSTATKNWH